MITFELVLILNLGSIVRCFPSSKGDSNYKDLEQLVPQPDADKSDIKKLLPQNLTVINFLKKLDFDPKSFNIDYAGLHEFCNLSNWELNNTHIKTDVSRVSDNLENFTETNLATFEPAKKTEVNSFQDAKSTEYFGSSTEYSHNNQSTESFFETELSTTKNYNSSDETTLTQGTSNYENSSEENPTADSRDIDHPDDGIFIRIVLILILMLQNIFLFVMVLFYRSMKKTNKKCIEQLRK